jgi:hypothetical protein
MKGDYGLVEFEGNKYELLENPQLSNRVFPGWWGDAERGESYTDEWNAYAEDKNGDKFDVYWQWSAIKGSEPEDAADLPFFDKNIVKVDKVRQ